MTNGAGVVDIAVGRFATLGYHIASDGTARPGTPPQPGTILAQSGPPGFFAFQHICSRDAYKSRVLVPASVQYTEMLSPAVNPPLLNLNPAETGLSTETPF